MSTLTHNRKAVNRSRLAMLGMLLAFMLPAILANMAYDRNWLSGGQTNRGELIPAGTQVAVSAKSGGQWQVVVLPDQQTQSIACSEVCRHAGFVAEQVRLTLGRESDRVQVVTLTELQDPAWQALRQSTSAKLFIVDPKGHVVLGYPMETDQDAMLQVGRGMQKDLKRLLKYSRAG